MTKKGRLIFFGILALIALYPVLLYVVMDFGSNVSDRTDIYVDDFLGPRTRRSAKKRNLSFLHSLWRHRN